MLEMDMFHIVWRRRAPRMGVLWCSYLRHIHLMAPLK